MMNDESAPRAEAARDACPCPAGGAEVGEAKFCPECGAEIKATRGACGACGHRPEAETNFCPECGAPMSST
jgi:membrane protease subunit (stomatin/prohibitin family)